MKSRGVAIVALLVSLLTLTAPPFPVTSAATPLTESEPAPLGSVAGDDNLLSTSDDPVPVGVAEPTNGPAHTLDIDPSTRDVRLSSSVSRPEQAGDSSTPVPGRYIVRVARGRSPSAIAGVLVENGLDAEPLSSLAMKSVVVETDPSNPDELRTLARTDGVAQVWQDQTVTLTTDQSNPPWGLDRIDQESLPLDSRFSYDTDGTGVTAYIVDTGTRGTHQDFGGRVTSGWSGTGEPGNGDTDCHGHGTHVAGTVAGSSYGVAKNAAIVPIRVLSCDGSGQYSTIIAGLDWAIAHHQPGVPAVMNMSLGGPGYAPLDAAIAATVADGIVVVVAAGNENTDACNVSPARAPSAITVGATNSADDKAWFSNYGPCLDVWAPGVDITSAYRTSDTSAVTMSGTSMAAPHVAGIVARLLDANPSLTVDEITSIVTGNTVLVDNRNIVQSPLYAGVATPAAPTGLAATPRNGAAVIQWNTPPAGVDAIVLSFSTGGSVTFSRRTTRYEKFDVVNGQSITVTARGLNSAGFGPSSTITVTPVDDGTPDRPTLGRIGSGNQWLNVEVNFPAVPTGGAVSTVTVTATPLTGSAVTATASVELGVTQKVVKVSGLDNHVSYSVTATAINGTGSSAPSESTSAMASAATNVSGAWSSTHESYPSPARAPMVVDEDRNLVWAGGVGRGLVALDVETRLAATGTLPAGTGMWLFLHESTGRVLAVPNRGGTAVYELGVSGSTVTATSVASVGFTPYAAHLDQSTDELLVLGSSLKRYSIGSSGALTELTVPSLSFGGDIGTSISVSGTRVAMSSNLGGWVKTWDRSNNAVATASGFTYPGTVYATTSAVLLTPTQASTIHKLSWNGATLSTLDLRLPIYAGGTFNGSSYPHRYYDIASVGGDVVVMLVEAELVSLDISTMIVRKNGFGYGTYSRYGSLTENEQGVLLANLWLNDVDGDLRSRWKDFAAGSDAGSSGTMLNAARRAIAGERFGAIYVFSSAGNAVRVVERASSPLNVTVDSANGVARVRWEQPERITDAVDAEVDAEYQLRPVTYDVVLQPGNTVHRWPGGPLDLSISGLDPNVTYTAIVRARSPGGYADSEPETFTPSTTSSRPATPATVTTTKAGEGCLSFSWSASPGADAGYRVEFAGRAQTVSIQPGVTSLTQCDFIDTAGVMPEVSARVTAISTTADSVPSAWTDSTIPSTLPIFEGAVNTTAFSEALGVAAATTFAVTATESTSRRTGLAITDDSGVRFAPLPSGTPAILGIDEIRREILVARCNVVNGGVMTVSIDDPTVLREIPLPATNQWEYCGAGFDPVRRAVWVAPTLYSDNDNFDADGTDIIAVSVDTPRHVVASSNLTCQPGTWPSSIYVVSSPKFLFDNGIMLASCMTRETSGFKPEYSVVTNAVTGQIVRSHTQWIGPVGATHNGDVITVTDEDLTVHSSTPLVVSFPSALGYDDSTLGIPLRDNDLRGPRVYRRSGDKVTVLPNSGNAYTIDTTTGSLGSLLATNGSSPWGALVAVGDAAVSLTNSEVRVTRTSSYTVRSTPTNVMDFASLPRGGQRVGMWGYGYEPTHMDWLGEDRLVALAKMRVPDNLGVPTDELYYAAFWNIRPPSRPTLTSRSAGSVSWSHPSHSPNIAAGTTARWEMNLPVDASIVRGGTGTSHCTTSTTTCSSANSFGSGASIEARSIGSSAHRMFSSPLLVDGLTLPVAPRLVPRIPTVANTLTFHVGMMGASATTWEASCAAKGKSLTQTGAAPTIVQLTAPAGLWVCRARAFNGQHAGNWGTPVVVESRSSSGVSSPLSTTGSSISMASGSGSFICRNGATTVTGSAGQTVAAGTGQWTCAVTLADQTSIGVLASVHATPSAPSGLSFSTEGTRVILSYELSPATQVADTSATVSCAGSITYSGSVVRTSVDIGAAAPGTVTCTVARNYLVPGSDSPQTTATSSASFVSAREVHLRVTGNGQITSGISGVSCLDNCTSIVPGSATVTLTAVPSSGWQFSSWSEPSCVSTSCTIDLTSIDTLEATFIENPVTTTTSTVPPSTTPPPPATTPPVTTTTTTAKPTTTRVTRSFTTTSSRFTVTSLAKATKVSIAKGATTSLTSASSSRRVCTTSKNVLRFLRTGTCKATLTISSGTRKTIVSVTIVRRAPR